MIPAHKHSTKANPIVNQSNKFWKTKTLEEMTHQEWESLCDGCGKCCLEKLDDEDTGIVYTTAISCRLLDCQTCRCTSYSNRFNLMDDCIKLTPHVVRNTPWLPKTCAYRLVRDGENLYSWHPLITGDPNSTKTSGNSVKEFVLHPYLADKPFYEYIIDEDE